MQSLRVFVDVGGHYGETLRIALNPKWGFDKIHVLEPASACQPTLKRFRDSRISLHPIALADRNGTAQFHGAGLLGGSLLVEKRQIADASQIVTEEVNLRRASDWFKAHIPDASEVYLKLNCEGGEVAILEDIIASGVISKVTSMYVDFDIQKVPGQEWKQQIIERQLNDHHVRYNTRLAGEGSSGSVERWLEMDCQPKKASVMGGLSYRLGFHLPPYEQATRLLSIVLPRRVYWWIGHRFGRLSRSRSHENKAD